MKNCFVFFSNKLTITISNFQIWINSNLFCYCQTIWKKITNQVTINSVPTWPQRLPTLTRPIRLVDPVSNPNSLSNYCPTPTPNLTRESLPHHRNLCAPNALRSRHFRRRPCYHFFGRAVSQNVTPGGSVMRPFHWCPCFKKNKNSSFWLVLSSEADFKRTPGVAVSFQFFLLIGAQQRSTSLSTTPGVAVSF